MAGEPSVTEDPLVLLVRELLLQRTERLNGASLAAFVDGWATALDLMRRTDLLIPGAAIDVKIAIAELIERLREVQYQVLDDGTG